MASSSKHKLDSAGAGEALDVAAYLHSVQHALVPLTRTAAQLPSASDLEFHRSLNPALANKLDSSTHALLDLVNSLTAWIDPATAAATALAPASLPSNLTTNVPRAIGDLVDSLLERADINLDEYAGKREPRKPAFSVVGSKSSKTQAKQAQAQEANAKGKGKQSTTAALPSHITNAPIKKPQRLFTNKPDNRSHMPWTRPLKYGKPHATKTPLAQSGTNRPGGPDPKQVWKNPKTRQGMWCSEGDPQDNPYFNEIVQAELPAHACEPRTPIRTEALDPDQPEAPTNAGPFTWVDTAEGIHTLLAHLKEDRVREIAIDLEHTSYRSYMGLTCLMQISTRWGDWIVDTLADPVRETAELLNEAFADPSKIKVLHGADHDILWMQRDLGLYIVGLFDTYQAACILDYPMKGLAYLLERFCSFHADKRYQLADWRIRPLSKEMLYYAREDTHDLLYVYDSLLTELRAKTGEGSNNNEAEDAIRAVFQRSKATAAKTYAKDVWDEEGYSRDGWRTLVIKYGGMNATPNVPRQLWLVRALHRWRDEMARKEDESPKYVLSSTHLLALGSKAPRSPQETLNIIKSGPRELKARLGELTKLLVDEVRAFEAHVNEAAEAVRVAAMGGVGGDGSKMVVGPGLGGGESSDEEEVGEVVKDGDVDMFEVGEAKTTESGLPAAAAAALPPTKPAPKLIEDVSTKFASSPLVAPNALWSGSVGATTTKEEQAEGEGEKAPEKEKPKRSLFSLPSGFGGRSLFGSSSSTTPKTEAGSAIAPVAVAPTSTTVDSTAGAGAGRPVGSTLFGGLQGGQQPSAKAATGTKSTRSASSSSSASRSSTKAGVIRAGFAAAVGGLLGSAGENQAGREQEAVPAASLQSDYEIVDAGAPSSAGPVGKMASGRKLSSITQKLLSRGFHNDPTSTTTAEGEKKKDEDDVGAKEGKDLSAFGDVIRLKKKKEKGNGGGAGAGGKKRGSDEAEVEMDGGTLAGGVKKARLGGEPSSSTTTAGTAATGFLKPFDLANEVSILDMGAPAAGSAGGKRGKGKKGGGGGGGRGGSSGGGSGGSGANFGPAPRKRNELGSGNRSATFR
ncbi:unnamed protein product [Tilletia caries]|uniref:HRDC domain-containing protein n=1 Tax=Tilletia caries TaxID=13290 RepID=A0A177V9X7_9BASI|nr:hypothetical protein CF336_g3000 [Tilletia laevis]KAE8255476.1 hypothetical protein A4X03_0g5557 [Tilletia caries]KAE8202063.1 hypothetical protein CF335_g3557 [Tilletia laevis]CAD6888013.1 unnamed protein product [Tilletia caries]CAD6903498.1 unnamed protein product [Tilletia caries]